MAPLDPTHLSTDVCTHSLHTLTHRHMYPCMSSHAYICRSQNQSLEPGRMMPLVRQSVYTCPQHRRQFLCNCKHRKSTYCGVQAALYYVTPIFFHLKKSGQECAKGQNLKYPENYLCLYFVPLSLLSSQPALLLSDATPVNQSKADLPSKWDATMKYNLILDHSGVD